MSSKIILACLLSLAAAQNKASTTTISIPWIGGDGDGVLTDISASIISANPTATTMALYCATATPDCGLFPAEILVVGPSTYNINMGDPTPGSDFTATMDCVVAKSAVCMESASGSEANFPGSSTTTYEADEVATAGLIVTAGVEKLNAKVDASTTVESKASSTGISTSVSGSAGSKSSSLAASTGSVQVSASASATGSAAKATATGAAPVNAVSGGLLGIAAGVLGGLLL
ncbi:gpi anchored [Pyrenophora seminiperda CCB06]|uniref:Gpi anchored n=1 Tax=Pyrenophora seminiperda CCB06 TaxID=1302712 RepID=A0A3M7M6M8_9PLEO|nr:gpi anchored [Pyrenophora seminiperda CCB06]